VVELRHPASGIGTIGFWLGAPHRGAGVMREAADAVVAHGFAELGVRRMGWEAVVGNVGSAATARSLGFRYEGVARAGLDHRGELLDGWRAALLPGDDRSAPGPWPIP
jgi:RimJ/RimL family protein N-acetyltransferase